MIREKISSQPAPFLNQKPLIIFFIIFAISLFILFFRLGERSLRNPDEGRYAEIAREMLVTGDWLSPTLCGVSYLRKPPMFYWLTALSFKLFGLSEFSARLVPALSSLAVISMAFWFSYKYFGSRIACLASLILATNLWFVQVGRFMVMDSLFTCFLTACLFSFFNSLRNGGSNFRWKLMFYFSMSGAFLTKGLAGIAIPILAIASYAFLTRRILYVLSKVQIWMGGIVFILTAGPVYYLLEKSNPGFIKFFFLNEHFRRFLSSDFEHQKDWYYYFVIVFLIFFPWFIFIRFIRASFSKMLKCDLNDPRFFLCVSTVSIVIFLSLSKSKLPTYILPCIPMISILIAYGWNFWLETRASFSWKEIGAVLLIFFASLGAILSGAYILQTARESAFLVIGGGLQFLGGILLTGCVLCWRAVGRSQVSKLFYSIVLTLAMVTIFFTYTLEGTNASYTTKAFAVYLKDKISPEDEIYIYDHPGPFYDFNFYLNRSAKLIGLEGEMTYSKVAGSALDTHLTREQFFDRIKSGKKLYCLIRKSDFNDLNQELKANLKILKQDQRKILFVSGFSGGTLL